MGEDDEALPEGAEVEDFDADSYMKKGEAGSPAPSPPKDDEPPYDAETLKLIEGYNFCRITNLLLKKFWKCLDADKAREEYREVDRQYKEIESEIEWVTK